MRYGTEKSSLNKKKMQITSKHFEKYSTTLALRKGRLQILEGSISLQEIAHDQNTNDNKEGHGCRERGIFIYYHRHFVTPS